MARGILEGLDDSNGHHANMTAPDRVGGYEERYM